MKHIIAATMFASVLGASPAYAQAWIGQIAGDIAAQQAQYQAELRCRRGEAPLPSERQLSRIRESAHETMTAYAALAAGGTFDASSVFSRRDHSWLGPDGAKSDNVNAVTDPLLGAAGRSLGEPAQIVRAGDTRSAIGRWLVRGEAGEIVGAYVGAFKRERGRWLLTRLEIEVRSDEPPPLSIYCHFAGDLDAPEASVVAAAAAAAPVETSAKSPPAASP